MIPSPHPVHAPIRGANASTAPHAASASLPHPASADPALRFDDDGFLVDSDRWTPALAEALAAEAGIARLQPAHWRVIDHVRQRYFALGSLPVMRLVCRAAGIAPGQAHELFSGCAAMWRIAGLPNPGEEAKAYWH